MELHKRIESELDNYLERLASDTVKHLRHTLIADLYHGPVYTDGQGCWLAWGESHAIQFNFGRASQILTDWLDDKLPRELWYNEMTGYFETSEPEGYNEDGTSDWIEPFWSDYWHFEWPDIKSAFLGRELANTI